MIVHRALMPTFALMSAGLLVGCAALPCSESACREDQALVEEAERLLAQYADLGPPNLITVQAHAGVVYLHGLVATDLQKQEAEEVIKQSPRVRRVANMIGLDNVSL